MKYSIVIALLLSIGCSAINSVGDHTYLIWKIGQPIDDAKTPPDFVVSPQEIYSVIPITKYSWNIYADDENYYLSADIQKLSSPSGDNSSLARRNGIRINGKSRDEIEKINSFKGTNKFISVNNLRSITKGTEQ